MCLPPDSLGLGLMPANSLVILWEALTYSPTYGCPDLQASPDVAKPVLSLKTPDTP